jgi:DNA helicase II / ATP-dependent DNA helicase PcrA
MQKPPIRRLRARPPKRPGGYEAILAPLSPFVKAKRNIGRVVVPTRISKAVRHSVARLGDLLEHIAARYAARERFLTELTLDPPEATGAEAGTPLLDEHYLILSTIHSAKGQEWDAVFILNVTDGCILRECAKFGVETGRLILAANVNCS